MHPKFRSRSPDEAHSKDQRDSGGQQPPGESLRFNLGLRCPCGRCCNREGGGNGIRPGCHGRAGHRTGGNGTRARHDAVELNSICEGAADACQGHHIRCLPSGLHVNEAEAGAIEKSTTPVPERGINCWP